MSEPSGHSHEGVRDDADAKAWFYLDHRADIEAWAALRTDGRDLLDKYLVGLEAHMETFAEEVGAELEASDLETGSWPTVGLHRSSWVADGVPYIDVVIQWERSRLLSPGSNEWPYVGVPLLKRLEDDDLRRQASDALRDLRPRLNGRASRNFPLWSYARPVGALVNPDAFAMEILASFRRLWAAVYPILDDL
jgi:hypothetical protein